MMHLPSLSPDTDGISCDSNGLAKGRGQGLREVSPFVFAVTEPISELLQVSS